MIRFIFRGWTCRDFYFERVHSDRLNYRGVISMGPFAVDWWSWE